MEREWICDSSVSCLQIIGGPMKRENILVGLRNGQVLKLFIDNSFPIQLFRGSVEITSCALSVNKKKIAVLDLNKNLTGFDLVSQTQLFQ